MTAAHSASRLGQDSETLYSELLRMPPGSSVEVVKRSCLSPAMAQQVLDGLLTVGLAYIDGPTGAVRAAPPREAIDSWASRLEADAITAREAAARLSRLYSAATESGAPFVDILTNGDDIVRTFRAMQDAALDTVRGFDRGPYIGDQDLGAMERELNALDRSVQYRVVYEASVLGAPDRLHAIQSILRAGEQGRVFPGVPMKLVISDDQLALIALPAVFGSPSALVVRPSGLLTAFDELFEAIWRLSVPMRLATGDEPGGVAEEPTQATHRLLALLTAGLTDELIARELAISERTVQRRIARLQELLAARTRFQLGIQAVRKGWL